MIVAAFLALPLGFWLGLLVFPGPIGGVAIAALAWAAWSSTAVSGERKNPDRPRRSMSRPVRPS